MDEILVRLLRGEERKQAAPFLFRSQQAALQQNGLVLAAYCGDVICGAAGVSPGNDVLRLLTLFVAEPYRRRGVAADLLREVENVARTMGLPQIYVAYSCAPEQARALHSLFLRHGYLLPEEGETLFRLPVANLKTSYFATLPAPSVATQEHIMPLRSLPAQAALAYSQLSQTDELSFLPMKHAPGKVLPPLCLAYVHNQQICALLIMCEANGCLHISGAYVAQAEWGKALVALLQTAFHTMQEKYPQYDTLTVTAASKSSEQLIERLLAGAMLARQTSYQTSKLVPPDALIFPPGFGGVMARCNTLTEELAARGVASRLVMTEGELPYLELDIAQGSPYAALYYKVQGDEAYESFQLSAVVDFPADGMDAAQQDALCARMNQTGSAEAFVLKMQSTYIRLYDAIQEEPRFEYQKVVDEFILPYLAQAERCAALVDNR